MLLVALVGAMAVTRPLNALALGEQVAPTLGANILRTRVTVLALSPCSPASATAVAGPIAFVGLIVPHLARRLAVGSIPWLMAYSMVLAPSCCCRRRRGPGCCCPPARCPCRRHRVPRRPGAHLGRPSLRHGGAVSPLVLRAGRFWSAPNAGPSCVTSALVASRAALRLLGLCYGADWATPGEVLAALRRAAATRWS